LLVVASRSRPACSSFSVLGGVYTGVEKTLIALVRASAP
jgi:hypothetical protein